MVKRGSGQQWAPVGVRVVLAAVLMTATADAAAGWQFSVDGATDEIAPCDPSGCGALREVGQSIAIDASGDVAIGGAFRELGNSFPPPSSGNVTSAGVVKLAPAGATATEVWRSIPVTVAPAYTQTDPFYPQGMCHLGDVSLLQATASGDFVGAGVCKVFPAPASHLVVRYDGATGAVVWVYGPDFNRGPRDMALVGGSVLVLYSGVGARLVALDENTGIEQWTKSLAAIGLSDASRLAVASTGHIVLIGSDASGAKVVRLSGVNGALDWSFALNTPSGSEDNGLSALALTAGDAVVVAGKVAGGDGGDFLVLKLSAAGAEQWRYTTRGNSAGVAPANVGNAVAVDAGGDVYAGGTLTVAGHPVNPANNGDAVIVKLAGGSGALLWTRIFDGGGNTADGVDRIAVDSAGDPLALLSLWTQRTPSEVRTDPVLVKLHAGAGSTAWLRRPMDPGAPVDDDEWVVISQFVVDASDAVTAVGSIFSQQQFQTDYDAFIWRILADGSATPCGDGTMDPGEACDDGDGINGNGCDNNCTVSTCGNGIAAGAEVCDDGNASDGDGCDGNCTASACGNGIPGGSEACDDGNLVNGDGCDSNCTISACGNGISAGAEACDDGNLVNGDGCDSNCTMPACGNGIVAGAEACDDGNLSNGDGCESDCTIAGCGNGSVGGAEVCDDGDLISGDGCDANCRPTGCGNGVVSAGEICDDGNLVSGDGCDANCRPTGCGNGVVAGAETCDDGNGVSGDGCDANCTPTACGNGVRTTGEQCDDGNFAGGDGCEATCQFTPITVAEAVGPGGTVSTDTIGGATAAYPAQASVTTPTGGDVSITKLASVVAPQNGYATLGMVMQIDAPPAASAAAPLQIVLTIDASVVPAGATPATVEVFKDGVLVPDCTGPAGSASPDPCVDLRQLLPGADIRLTVLTTTASSWAVAAPTHDALVRSLKPLALRFAAAVTKTLKVQVVNGDPKTETDDLTIRLGASTDCPGSAVTQPDFDADQLNAQDTVTLRPGKKGKADVTLSVAADGVTGINAKAPVRCSITFTATVTAPAGSVDGNESNNVSSIDVDLHDTVDPGVATGHETVMTTLKPLKMKIAEGGSDAVKSVKLSVVNADILPAPEAGHQVTVSASDGTCPAGTLTGVDADAATDGPQGTVQAAGGAKKSGAVTVTVNSAAFSTGGAKAPARCVALLTATGPSGDVDARNDTARLVIDVYDHNDY